MNKRRIKWVIIIILCFAVGFALAWLLFPPENDSSEVTLEEVTQPDDSETFTWTTE